jgi:V8-like Glu-specific endopeptidase
MLQLQVCQVEAAVSGTGFLVAPDLILTNYHVVEQEIKSDRATNVICRFDFTRDLTGEFRGTAMGLASTEWCVAYSPYAPADVSGGGRLPNANELDYALLRLAGAPQVLPPMPGQVGRGHVFVSASAAVPAEGRDIKVIQHPERMPQCIGVGKAIGLADGGLRFRYTAETREGSSGSPVFDAEFSLVALHHAGQPGSKLTPGDFNQGIPISKIVLDLRSKCVDKFWE